MGNWQSISNEKERYSAYLCSREWAVLKEAVHKRANGTCERCRVFPISAVHHKTYERKYNERLEDLEGHCEHCHAFTHGKAEFDPRECKGVLKYLLHCRETTRQPVPWQALSERFSLCAGIRVLLTAVDQLQVLYDSWWADENDLESGLEHGMLTINEHLPFDYCGSARIRRQLVEDPIVCGKLYAMFGFSLTAQRDWMEREYGEDE